MHKTNKTNDTMEMLSQEANRTDTRTLRNAKKSQVVMEPHNFGSFICTQL